MRRNWPNSQSCDIGGICSEAETVTTALTRDGGDILFARDVASWTPMAFNKFPVLRYWSTNTL